MKWSANKLLYRDAFLCTIMTFIVAALLYSVFINLSILDPFEKAFKDFKFTDMFYSERYNESLRNREIVSCIMFALQDIALIVYAVMKV